MSQDDKELDKLSDNGKNKDQGDNDMAVVEKELKDMQKLQQKTKMTRDQLRKALIKQSIKNNYEALHRLSRT